MAATGAISGTVTGAGAHGPIKEDQVCAHGTNSSFSSYCASTNLNGEFTIASAPAGEYRVHFESKGEYIGQWFDGVAGELEAQLVAVAGSATTEDTDAELALGAAVEGAVTDATSGAGLEHVSVCAATANSNPINNGCTTTGPSGHYRLVGIPTGEYRLRFEPEYSGGDPDYLRHYYPDAEELDEGTVLHLIDGQTTTGIDTAMHLGGTISGTVVDPEGNPVKGVTACVYPVLGNANGGYCVTHRAETAADGTYTIHALSSGEYKVRFSGGTGSYLSQFYPDQATRALGGPIVVDAPEAVTGIDAAMQAGGTISGYLVEGSHFPIPYADVCAFRVGGTAQFCSQAKSDGSYLIKSLPSGEYLVEFAGPDNSTDWPYVPTFYEETSDRGDAKAVHVTAGSETSGIGAAVPKGGTISGLVTDAVSAEPAEGIYVCAYSGGEVVGHCDTTHASGEYTIIGLPSGSYAVHATPAGGGPFQDFLIGNKHYAARYYGEATTEGTATPVASGPGTEATGKDIAMHEGGGISGTVTGPLGEPLPGVEACVVKTAESFGEHCGATGTSGEYEIPGLDPGEYVVGFWVQGPPSLSSQYFDGVQSFGEAEPVKVTGSAVTPGIDAQMHPSGAIEGTVTDAYDASPLADVWVCAEPIAGTGGKCAETEADGHYSMDVGAGSYQVRFSFGYYEESNGEEFEVEEFVTQFFDGASTAGAATPVTVASGATHAGIDAALSPAPGRVDTVSVAKAGAGSGTITSSPAGIDCGSTCSDGFETRKTVTLHAESAAGSTFAGWTGACTGTGPCTIRLTAAASASATFESNGGSSQEQTSGETNSSPSTSTSGGSTTTTQPESKPKPKVLHCKKGYKVKKAGKVERCVKVRKHHARKHRAKGRHS